MGRVGGFTLPTPLSPAQFVALFGSFLGLLATRRVWGLLLPGMAQALVLIAIPLTLTWAVRHLRMEGRSPVKMLMGIVTLLLSPTRGTVRGHQMWSPTRRQRSVAQVRIVGDTTDAPIDPSESVAVVESLPVRLGTSSPWSCLNGEAA